MAELTPAEGRRHGWPFLVARTYATGYHLVLAPRVLAETAHDDVVNRTVAAGDDVDGPAVRTIQVGAAAMSLVYRTHRLTSADVAQAPTAEPDTAAADPAQEPAPGPTADRSGADSLVLDEHGRPIVMVYGFVCLGQVCGVAEEDLAVARTRALTAYRRVTRAGSQSDEVSEPFVLASDVQMNAPSAARHETTAPHVDNQPVHPGTARRWLLAAAATVALATVTGGLVLTRPTQSTRPPDGFAGWIGTWDGRLEPAQDGSYAPRDVTVTLTCATPCVVNTGQAAGNVDDQIGCLYTVAYQGADIASVTLSVTPSTAASGCLPAGRVDLSRAPTNNDRPDNATLRWHPNSSDANAVMVGTDLRRR